MVAKLSKGFTCTFLLNLLGKYDGIKLYPSKKNLISLIHDSLADVKHKNLELSYANCATQNQVQQIIIKMGRIIGRIQTLSRDLSKKS